MKSFLESAIYCFKNKKETWQFKSITTDEQFRYIKNSGHCGAARASNTESVYLLLFIAAERGEL